MDTLRAVTSTANARAEEAAAMGRLSTLDRYLPLWIAVAMAAGLGLGALIPGFDDALDALQIGTVSLPIALGLLLMMYPVLAKVRYEELGRLRGERKLIVSSLVLNWIVGPLLMFAVAWIFLADQPEYRTGLIVVGLARCIAMVLIWTDLACADREATALLVAINSLLQIVAYSLLGWIYLTGLPDLLGLDSQGFEVSIWEVARTVLIFLGIPLLAGYLTRVIGLRRRGAQWYEERFLPRIGPVALYGLLFTIVMLFALQGDAITSEPLDVVRIAVPLLVYFAVMFAVSFATGAWLKLGYARTSTLAFTAASNNFELAIAVAVGVWGATSGQALAGVVGPLIEVPVLVALVYVALWLRRRCFANDPDARPDRRARLAEESH
jgi:ACR3 family arsenite transporter